MPTMKELEQLLLEDQQVIDAALRHSVQRLREEAEEIACLQGGVTQKETSDGSSTKTDAGSSRRS
jgi:hypothetical protein